MENISKIHLYINDTNCLAFLNDDQIIGYEKLTIISNNDIRVLLNTHSGARYKQNTRNDLDDTDEYPLYVTIASDCGIRVFYKHRLIHASGVYAVLTKEKKHVRIIFRDIDEHFISALVKLGVEVDIQPKEED